MPIKFFNAIETDITCFLSDLISINTTNPPGNETQAAKFIVEYLSTTRGTPGRPFNYLWAPMGANVAGKQAEATYFSRASWMYDLARRWDGGFEYNTYGQGNNGGPSMGRRGPPADVHRHFADLCHAAAPALHHGQESGPGQVANDCGSECHRPLPPITMRQPGRPLSC